MQGLPWPWGRQTWRAHCPAEQELTNCRQVEGLGPFICGHWAASQLPVRPTRSADLRTAGDVGTVSLGVHTGIPRPGSWPRVTQLPGGAPRVQTPSWQLTTLPRGRCWPLSLHCTLCFLTGDQCSDEAWLNHHKNPSRMPSGIYFS